MEAKSPFMIETEAAEFLRLRPGTLQNRRLSGDGPPYIKLGPGRSSRVMYDRDALIAWARSQSRTSTSEAAV